MLHGANVWGRKKGKITEFLVNAEVRVKIVVITEPSGSDASRYSPNINMSNRTVQRVYAI